jgi:hypothetical protein
MRSAKGRKGWRAASGRQSPVAGARLPDPAQFPALPAAPCLAQIAPGALPPPPRRPQEVASLVPVPESQTVDFVLPFHMRHPQFQYRGCPVRAHCCGYPRTTHLVSAEGVEERQRPIMLTTLYRIGESVEPGHPFRLFIAVRLKLQRNLEGHGLHCIGSLPIQSLLDFGVMNAVAGRVQNHVFWPEMFQQRRSRIINQLAAGPEESFRAHPCLAFEH